MIITEELKNEVELLLQDENIRKQYMNDPLLNCIFQKIKSAGKIETLDLLTTVIELCKYRQELLDKYSEYVFNCSCEAHLPKIK